MSKGKKVAFLGIFCGLALMLSYLESLIPLNFAVPGIKLGLANLVVVFVLYYLDPLDAVLVNLVRILITGLLFGNLFSILFSVAGALVSFFVMWPLSRLRKYSCIGISIAGGVTHNLAQIAVAAFVIKTVQIFYYIPVLLISGLACGLVMGILAKIVIKNIRKIRYFDI